MLLYLSQAFTEKPDHFVVNFKVPFQNTHKEFKVHVKSTV